MLTVGSTERTVLTVGSTERRLCAVLTVGRAAPRVRTGQRQGVAAQERGRGGRERGREGGGRERRRERGAQERGSEGEGGRGTLEGGARGARAGGVVGSIRPNVLCICYAKSGSTVCIVLRVLDGMCGADIAFFVLRFVCA